jgi:hypothetical protein
MAASGRILVIVTTIELDPKHDRYSENLVRKLARAAEEHLGQSSETTGFMLVNRPKDWPKA